MRGRVMIDYPSSQPCPGMFHRRQPPEMGVPKSAGRGTAFSPRARRIHTASPLIGLDLPGRRGGFLRLFAQLVT